MQPAIRWDGPRPHREWRQGVWAYIGRGSLLALLTAPLTYALLLPLLLLDIWVMALQQVCFRAWGVAVVPRSEYLVIDRHRLAYLNGIEKLNCVFCGYANGLLAYVREVAARTEQYWCPIRHAREIPSPHVRYGRFTRYGDARGYRVGLSHQREQLGPGSAPGRPRRASR